MPSSDPLKAPNFAFLIFLCLLPFLLYGGIFIATGTSPADFHVINSDETDYWAESVTISRHGLFKANTGYFGYNLDQHAKLLNYGAHAPFNLLPFAAAGLLSGGAQWMMLLANAVVLSLSLAGFYLASRSAPNSLLLAALLFSFLPFALYFFTGMVELLIFAGVILFIPFYEKLWEPGTDNEKWFKAYLLMVILWSFFRLTHILFLLPAMVYEMQIIKRKPLAVLGKYALLVLACTALLWVFTASFPWSFVGQWLRSSAKLAFFFRHGLSMSRKFLLPGFGTPMEVVLRYAYLLWLALLTQRFFSARKAGQEDAERFLAGHLLVLLAHLVFVLFFYDFDEMRGFRMLSPILFFSTLSCLFSRLKPLPKPVNLASIGLLWGAFLLIALPQSQTLWKETVLRRLEPDEKAQVLQWIRFDPKASNRWENTVYLDLFDYTDLDYGQFSPGIGLMTFRVDELDGLLAQSSPDSMKARYLISSADREFPGYELLNADRDLKLYLKAAPE